MLFQGVDLGLLIKLLFVFEGAIVWKGTEFVNKNISQFVDYEKSCESFHNDVKYDEHQMYQIRIGLENNIDINYYMNNNLTWEEMKEIRSLLESSLKNNIIQKIKRDNDLKNNIIQKIKRDNEITR